MSRSRITRTPFVLIWSGEHRSFWRANRSGYTQDVRQAGRYPRDEAKGILSGAGPEKGLQLVGLL